MGEVYQAKDRKLRGDVEKKFACPEKPHIRFCPVFINP